MMAMVRIVENLMPDSGHVRIFNLNSQNKWIQIGADIQGSGAGDEFGTSVSLSNNGNRLAVSSPGNDNDNGTNAGCARVFERNGSGWIQIGSDILGLAAGDYLWEVALSVALSGDGNTLAVSMPLNDDNGNDSGKVQIFAFIEYEWTKVGNNDDMTGSNKADQFGLYGLAISTDGMTVAAGSYDTNYVKVYTLVDGGWSLLGNVINGQSGEYFGWSVDLSDNGRRLIIGARRYNNWSGRAVIFDYDSDGDDWVTVGEPLYGDNTYDSFGRSVSISGSGNRIAVGGWGHDANGSNAGHVRVFDLSFDGNVNTWNQVDEDILGQSAGDRSGVSVALSNDAKFVAVGEYGRNSFTGRARVFEMKCQSEE